jgi:hypothetical protein
MSSFSSLAGGSTLGDEFIGSWMAPGDDLEAAIQEKHGRLR